MTKHCWRCRIEHDTSNPPYKFRIETPLFLFGVSKWGCTYLAFLRGGPHGGYRINFTWYRRTLAIILIWNWIWEHPRWSEFNRKIKAWFSARDEAQRVSTGGIQ